MGANVEGFEVDGTTDGFIDGISANIPLIGNNRYVIKKRRRNFSTISIISNNINCKIIQNWKIKIISDRLVILHEEIVFSCFTKAV